MQLFVDTASTDGNAGCDLKVAKAAGLTGMIVRANEGTWKDPDFHVLWTKAKLHGVRRGAYMLLRFDSNDSPEAQVNVLFEQLGGTKLSPEDLPPTIDLEFPGGRRPPGWDAAACLAWFLRARAHFAAMAGFEAMTYTSNVVWVDPAQMGNPTGPEVDRLRYTAWWIKYYPWPIHTVAHIDAATLDALPEPPCPPPAGEGGWAIEQTQGDAQKMPGFPGLVDVDRFHVLQLPRNVADDYQRGTFVAWAQRRVGLTGSDVDGIYGPATAAAVKRFQARHVQLTVDGVVGAHTFGYLAQVQLQ